MSLLSQPVINFLSVFVAFVMDYVLKNPLRPDWVDLEPVSLDATELKRFQTAVTLALNVSLITTNPPQDFYPDFTFAFQDMNDRSLVTFMDGTCYGVTKGTEPAFYDFMQGTGIFGTKKVCGSAGCCTLDRGITWAYYGEFYELFEEKLRECHHNFCPDAPDGCPVVLTGHSQGAAIATAAAVALADLKPILYSFGAQKILHKGHPCHILDRMETYLRVTTICDNDGLPSYDLNSYINPALTNTGTMIMLGHGGAATVAHNYDVSFMPFIEPCHSIYDPYITSAFMLEPGLLDGFVSGSVCSRHIECKSRQCVDQRCSDGLET